MNAALRRRILTSLCRLPVPPAKSIASLLQEVEDWPGLAGHIQIHGVQGICYPRLREEPLSRFVPDDVLESLLQSVRATSTKNLLHKSVLLKILDALSGEVPILLTKGITLMQHAYERPSMRPMADVDFYIRRSDIETLEKRMEEAGFVPEERRKRSRQWWIDNFQHLEPYLSPGSGVRVEPHLRNAGEAMPYRMDMEKVWDRCQRRDVEGRTVFVMAPDDDLAALVLHLYVHDVHLAKLLGLVDLDRTIRACEVMDWDRLLETGRDMGYDKLLHLPLALANKLLGAPVPNEVLTACRPDDLSESDLGFLEEYMFRENIAREQVPFGLTNATTSGGFSGKLKLVGHLAFPSGRELTERYNLPADSPAIWLYRLLHPFYLVRRWGRFLFGFFAGGRQKRLLGLTEKVAGWITRTDYREKR